MLLDLKYHYRRSGIGGQVLGFWYCLWFGACDLVLY